ncbi:MAG: polyprenyl synthetase family protein [Firmicutes bacterium]|nr:polyprenyl synthetase family protein [Bacillota bacterium]
MLATTVHDEVSACLEQVESELRKALSQGREPFSDISLYLLQSGGKRVRPILTLLSAQVFGGDVERIVPLAAAVELVHMATLVHDDVIDKATMRRGRPTVNSIWGAYPSVLAGDCLLARALVILVDRGTPPVIRIMADMIYRMCEGEMVQTGNLFNPDQTEEDYFSRIEKKTALFFSACAESGALLGGASREQAEAMARYGLNIGMAFQVVDDLLDIGADEKVLGKAIGSDLMAGVLTLPVIYLLERPAYRDSLISCLRSKKLQPSDVHAITDMIQQNGAMDYCYGVARNFAEQARQALTGLPSNDSHKLLQDIADFIVNRVS